MEQQEKKKIYKFFGKEYVLDKELVIGGCQGCAFANRLDCYKDNRSKICNKEHKIFKRYIKGLEE